MEPRFGAIELPIAGIRSPKIQWAYDYWLARKGDRELPSRADFLPEEMKPILGNMMVIDVAYDPLELRYTLFGTNLVEFYGRDLTGKSVADVEPQAFADLIVGLYRETISARRPMIHKVTYDSLSRTLAVERIMLPLSASGKRIDKLLTVSEHQKGFFQKLAEEAGAAV